MNDFSNGKRFFSVEERFAPIPKVESPFPQCVLPIFGNIAGDLRPIGTGFMINASGLMMTASHVIRWAHDHRIRKVGEDGNYYDHWEIYALWISNETDPDEPNLVIGGLIPIVKVWINDGLDIGLCQLNTPVDVRTNKRLTFPCVKLRPVPPRVGEQIIGFGYYGSSDTTYREDSILVDYDQKDATTRGEVVEVYGERRDRGMYNFPCFLTDAQFESGMSGGPIFCETGFVCGVISGGLQPTEEFPEYTSYGSTIWPSLAISLEVVLTPNSEPENILLYDFINRGFASTDSSIDEVVVKATESGTTAVHIGQR